MTRISMRSTVARVIVAAAIAAALCGVSAQGSVRDDLDCKMRSLALEFASHLQPSRPASAFQDLADALNGAPEKASGCSVSPPAGMGVEGGSRFGPSFAGLAGGVSFYVDPVSGSDSAAGSLAAPVRTIPAALVLARGVGTAGTTIVLRAGTHYLTATIALSAADSGLTITQYPGEAAWVSGAKALPSLTWTPFNVANASGSAWTEADGQNAVYAASPGGDFVINGTFSTWAQCQANCEADHAAGGRCTIWTWHDQTVEAGYRGQCWFRLDGVWEPHAEDGHFSGHLTGPPVRNIWAASLAGLGIASVPGVRLGGARLTRARFPNGFPGACGLWVESVTRLVCVCFFAAVITQPMLPAPPSFSLAIVALFQPTPTLPFPTETKGFMPPAVFRASWTPQSAPRAPDIQIDLPSPVRNTSVSAFQTFTAGIGGTCDRFQPNAGYWCSTKVQGGGSVIYYVPTAMQATQHTLPNTPYADATGAVVQTWRPGHWASWMYVVGSSTWDASTNTTNFNFFSGGFQGSRGENQGEDTYIENVLEELDAPEEWFFNETTATLYYFHNATVGTPPPSDGFEVTQVKALFNITGASQASPVHDVTLAGIGLRDTVSARTAVRF